VIVFLDESGFYVLPGMVRTWAVRGQTPVLRAPLLYDHLSVIGAITLSGQLLMQVQECAIRGPDVVRFLRHLLRHVGKRLLVIWDGLPAHRGQSLKQFLSQVRGRIHVERLPGYAPELNPKEGIWKHLKLVEMKNLCCAHLGELKVELRRAKERLRHKREVVRACFKQVGLL
jgi:transposase